MSFLNDIIKNSGNEYACTVEDGIDGSDVKGFIDTGSYAFNALVSGSLYGGIPNNKIIALAGESATGKTYFAIGMVKRFLENNKDAVVLYFDTEQAVTSDMFISRGIDSKRVAIFPVATVEEFRKQLITIADKYLEQDIAKRKPMMVVLDSLGMLSTSKEINDTTEGKEVRDMTRAQVIKSTFRVLTLKLGKAGIPLIMTNHTYDVIGSYVPMKEMGGGCLTENHKIRMSDLKMKNIQDVCVGDSVITLFGNQKVLETFKYQNKETVTIEFEDGSVVNCTPEHKFLIKMDDEMIWTEAKDIISGYKAVVKD
jgi:RecA/RadA recombinase